MKPDAHLILSMHVTISMASFHGQLGRLCPDPCLVKRRKVNSEHVELMQRGETNCRVTRKYERKEKIPSTK